jgi:hypothetical protein
VRPTEWIVSFRIFSTSRRVEAGALRLQCSPLSVRDLVIEAVTAQRSLADSSGRRLELDLESGGAPRGVGRSKPAASSIR